ncbi:Probable L,D-transpeptidase ErfK/SrfK precursor [Moraxella lacunata]|uniref:Probable L,D-transpeptidase ErfK/SrfK n=1 Tax=Moraxella lacunata TaxID=477 RepID=A0A378T647_MORLA|nr:L,D-transpeptidase [Moraxella lacunata]STZ56100.1 Probable L,D-transpeptidase ErfK/SrfK precursor [Moraxella lacunata]
MITLKIDTAAQTLTVFDDDKLIKTLPVSTAKNGTGQLENTGCTPLGKHIINDKIGGEYPKNAVFVGRVFTGEIYDDKLGQANPDRDWILSRILWLKGVENGYNLGKTPDGAVCDTHARYIYIHGTPDTEPVGVPMSHGCIRMRNDDVVWLYDVVDVGTQVLII